MKMLLFFSANDSCMAFDRPVNKLACCCDVIRGSQRLLKEEYYNTRIIYPKPDLLPAAVLGWNIHVPGPAFLETRKRGLIRVYTYHRIR